MGIHIKSMIGAANREQDDHWASFDAEAMPHVPSLFRIALWLTRDRTEAEDLVQETLTEALGAFHRFITGTNCHAWLVSILACVLLALLIGSIIVRQRLSGPPQNIELAKAAVGDHRDCAVEFRLAEKPIALGVAAHDYDPVYRGLAEIFANGSVAPPDMKFIEAHSCVFAGRRFAHVVLRYHGSLVSFLVTGIPGNFTFDHSPAKNSDTIVCSQIEGYNVSLFQTQRHGIFVVSSLPEGDNLALARALAPRISDHINNRERS